ncbi:MAG: hypothetical protein SGJ10_13645 [Bacteroidota bacterium]|nr:hypothetical protein [Bacteroidota bacterium]
MEFIYILYFTIPSLIVGLLAYLMLTAYFNNEEKKRNMQLRLKNEELFTPLRLQAYERMSLFLERISPPNLLPRVSQPGISAKDFKQLLIAEINHEYQHNLSQQIYVSHQVWVLIRAVKEQVVNMVNVCYTRMPEEAKAIDLSKAIFAVMIEQDENPVQKALDFLNKEVHIIFAGNE